MLQSQIITLHLAIDLSHINISTHQRTRITNILAISISS